MRKTLIFLVLFGFFVVGCTSRPEDAITDGRVKAARERVKAGEEAAPNLPRPGG